MDRFEGFHGGRGGRRKGRKQGWVSSRDMRDSSPALPAGSPQRWQSRCKLNLVCGCWLVRSSLGSARSEEGGLLPSGGRHSSVDRNRVCNLRGVRPLRPLARLAIHPPFSSSLSLLQTHRFLQVLCVQKRRKKRTPSTLYTFRSMDATMEKVVNIEGED